MERKREHLLERAGSDRVQRRRVAAALLLGSALLLPPPSSTAQEPEEATAASARSGQAESPEVVWLEDEQGKYYLEKYPKIEGTYRWVDEEKRLIRLGRLPPVPVFKEDDEFFYIRFNKVDRSTRPKAGPSEEDIAAVEATYPGVPESQDLLEMRSFDEGLPRTGQWRNGFALEDLNGDGHLDIAHGPARKSGTGPVVALGDSQGRWRRWEELTLPDLPYDYGDVAVGDFNGDGEHDLALAVHLRGFLVLAGDGEGGFVDMGKGLPMHGVEGRKTRHFTSRAIAAADWNRDGRPDLLALSEGPSSPDQVAGGVEALRGKAIFSFDPESGVWHGISSDPDDPAMGDHLAVGDLDGDGRLDFATDLRISERRELLNFATPDGRWQRRALESLRPTATAWAVELGDLDGDGDLDLVAAYRSFELGGARDGLDLFYNDGAGNFERRGLVSTKENIAFSEIGIGDLDGDGRNDVVGLDAKGRANLYLQRGAGAFVQEDSPEMLPDDEHSYCAGYRARLVDLNGDGRDELIATFAGEPGSEALFGTFRRCPARGAIRVWSPVVRGEGASEVNPSGLDSR